MLKFEFRQQIRIYCLKVALRIPSGRNSVFCGTVGTVGTGGNEVKFLWSFYCQIFTEFLLDKLARANYNKAMVSGG